MLKYIFLPDQSPLIKFYFFLKISDVKLATFDRESNFLYNGLMHFLCDKTEAFMAVKTYKMTTNTYHVFIKTVLHP